MFLLLALTWGWSVSAFAGTEVLNGGGGVCSSGVCTTFASFEVGLKGQSLTSENLKALELLKRELIDLPVSEEFKIRLTKNLMPSAQRVYYSSNEDLLSEAERKSILQTYASITGIRSESLKLFALTSIHRNATYLLPDFFKLGVIEQEVLLLHEQLWIVDPALNYRDVVILEMAFQSYLQSHDENREARRNLFVKKLAHLTGHDEEVLYADLNRLQDASKKVLLEEITGREFIECLYENQWRFSRYANFTCNSKLRMHLLKMSEADQYYSAAEELLGLCEINRDCVKLDSPGADGNHPLLLWIDVDSFDEFEHSYTISDEMNAPVGALKIQFPN
ncbi:hypothetical protein [Bdellovibrio svalbardensis]|uniref:Uncharacterized protein n=1 Tax=Bdellovibrio svalbardensis TaxID=2972972 RepID=A0ABT6DGC4_9BACT|nr:hypothetical protein [Bdellovibrio svalbardensis]MDG0815895.1 hypothetical protein [Bdellovibrio svalbardensis]